MKIKRIRNERGITVTILLMVIIIITILLGITIGNMDIGADIKNYNYMCADIELLEAKINSFYNTNNSIPITGESFNATVILGEQISAKDNSNYYVIDIARLNNITLNFGGGTFNNGDVYIVNEQSHKVYYLAGVGFDNSVYYSKKTR